MVANGLYCTGPRPSSPAWEEGHDNGQKLSEQEWKNGEWEGLGTRWDEDGSIDNEKSGIYKAGKKVAPLPKKQ